MGYVTETEIRVRYAETDQMGVVHHANYLVWFEIGRTNHMRHLGVSYRQLEERGVRLPVVEAVLRYRAPARYDDLVRIRCWVRRAGSRLVEFGNAVDRVEGGRLLATGQIKLAALDANDTATTIPTGVRDALVVAPDPVRM